MRCARLPRQPMILHVRNIRQDVPSATLASFTASKGAWATAKVATGSIPSVLLLSSRPQGIHKSNICGAWHRCIRISDVPHRPQQPILQQPGRDTITCALAVLLREPTQVLKGGEWAAVTAILIPYTTIGEGGPIALSQVLATAFGGYLAYGFVLAVQTPWALALLVRLSPVFFLRGPLGTPSFPCFFSPLTTPPETRLSTSLQVTLFTFVMHALSWWLSFEVTLPRIAVATYALVTVSDVQKSVSTLLVTTTRVLGITVGVVVALLVTTLVLPHSATDAVWCMLTDGSLVVPMTDIRCCESCTSRCCACMPCMIPPGALRVQRPQRQPLSNAYDTAGGIDFLRISGVALHIFLC